MPSPFQLVPEFFTLLGIDLFLMLSLLTCLLDDRCPKASPYLFQIAALVGFGQLLISRDFLAVFGEYMRFWYCFFYLTAALVNIVAVNVYLAAVKGLFTAAGIWSGTVTFPAILISTFFVSQYYTMQSITLPLTLFIVFTVAIGTGTGILLSHEAASKLFGKEKGVKQ
jgi:hypothetical protein